jgi:uncharacterized protein YgbK (DUF1537 family)
VPAYALIADDLTGALDAGAGFVRAGLRAVLPFSGRPEDAGGADVVLLNTASRERPAGEAGDAVRHAAEAIRAAGIERVYKKIDSVLRGHPGAELAALLDVIGGRAVVALAFPAQGRVTRGGVQYAHGTPVGPYGGSIRAALAPAADRCDVWDAETDADLRRIASFAAADPACRVWCGSAGLAACVPAALRLRPGPTARPAPPRAERVAVIAGTQHPATLLQIEALARAGWATFPLDARAPVPAHLADRVRDAMRPAGARCALSLTGEIPTFGGELAPSVFDLLRAAARAVPLEQRTGLILTGGETALHVCRALDAARIEVTGEALPGIPTGILRLPGGDLAVATKSGGFGGPDALLQTASALAAPPGG